MKSQQHYDYSEIATLVLCDQSQSIETLLNDITNELTKIQSQPCRSRHYVHNLAKKVFVHQNKPVIINIDNIRNNLFDHQSLSLHINLAIDENIDVFDAQTFIQQFTTNLQLNENYIKITSIKEGSVLMDIIIHSDHVKDVINKLTSSESNEIFVKMNIFCIEFRKSNENYHHSVHEVIQILYTDVFPELHTIIDDEIIGYNVSFKSQNIFTKIAEYFKQKQLNSEKFLSLKREMFVNDLQRHIGTDHQLVSYINKLYELIMSFIEENQQHQSQHIQDVISLNTNVPIIIDDSMTHYSSFQLRLTVDINFDLFDSNNFIQQLGDKIRFIK